MKTKLFISILLVTLAMALFGQNVGPKMCKVCGKPFSQCQYRGRHPQNTENTQPAKPASQSSSKPSNQSSAKPAKPSNGNTSSQAQRRTSFSASYSNGILTCNGVRYRMVRVEGGTFTMGATKEQGSDAYDDETPAHQVTLSTYSIGETEVTQELWEAVMGSNPSNVKGSKRPVVCVSWDDCQDFIKKLNAATGKTFRLPTEAEWEYAARGGNNSRGYKYSGSDELESVAWYTENSFDKGESSPDYGIHNVATKQSNELGLYDMSGNVYEWCSDWYGKDYYGSSPRSIPQGPDNGRYRVFRGGSWIFGARVCRSSSRGHDSPDLRNFILGLRLALSE